MRVIVFKANTTLSVLGLRLLSRCDGSHKLRLLEDSNASEDALRKSLRMAAMLLPMFAVVWFLGVLALENPSTLIFPVLFAAANSFLVSQKTFMEVILFNTECIHEFYVPLTVHPCIILYIKPNWCTIFLSMFISFLYMFQATMCPSSGGITVSTQHLVLVNLCG